MRPVGQTRPLPLKLRAYVSGLDPVLSEFASILPEDESKRLEFASVLQEPEGKRLEFMSKL